MERSEQQQRLIDAVNRLTEFVRPHFLPINLDEAGWEQREYAYQELRRLHEIILVCGEAYASEQYEKGHDRGYEDAEEDFLKGRWDD